MSENIEKLKQSDAGWNRSGDGIQTVNRLEVQSPYFFFILAVTAMSTSQLNCVELGRLVIVLILHSCNRCAR